VGEIRDGGVRVLKTDVAWVGAGYSFGLNGVADVAKIMPEQGNRARPFIITCDGWAGTQRYAGLWSGDQVGGQWEYIRFHIPTYIGSGLSGQPNVGSDMDGIFGGRNIPVNVRDFQWKTFTPMELNMDGWGANEKYPHALGKRVEDINRMWLKFKSALMPYTYSIASEAARWGSPMVRAMSWEKDEMSHNITHNGGTSMVLQRAAGAAARHPLSGGGLIASRDRPPRRVRGRTGRTGMITSVAPNGSIPTPGPLSKEAASSTATMLR